MKDCLEFTICKFHSNKGDCCCVSCVKMNTCKDACKMEKIIECHKKERVEKK